MKKDLQITKPLENTKENIIWLKKQQKRLFTGNGIETEIKQYKDGRSALFYKDYDDCPEQFKSVIEYDKITGNKIPQHRNVHKK